MATPCDLLIVGGGPGGLTLAILARQLGMTVTLIEAVNYPRVLHGQTMLSGMLPYFDAMGISRERLYRNALPFPSHRFRWNSSFDFVSEPGPEPEGLQVPRQHFEPMLLERAEELGVTVLQPCMAKRPLMTGERIVGVVTDRGEIRSRCLVDAGGGRHWLIRKQGWPIQFHSPPLFGYYTWARGHCPACHTQPVIYSDADGWVWLARVSHDVYQGTRMAFQPDPDYRHWLPREFLESGLSPIAPTRSADMTWRIAGAVAGPGFYLIGDAMRGIDLLMALGIERAMGDACRVAEVWRRRMALELTEEEAARIYSEEVRGKYLKQVLDSYALLRRHPQPPEWAQGESTYFQETVLH